MNVHTFAQSPTPAGYILSNVAEVHGINIATSNVRHYMTPVCAYYGISPLTIPSNKNVSAGSSILLNYTITNKGNTNDYYIIIVSNFVMSSGYIGSSWTATLTNTNTGLSYGSVTGISGAMVYYAIPTALASASSYSFSVRIDVPSDASPGSWGYAPIIITNAATINTLTYLGDNSFEYGGTNYRTTSQYSNTKIFIAGPNIRLVKTISNISSSPVPGARITYLIQYDNDGNGDAVNLVIRDMIPNNTAFVVGSINVSALHTAGAMVVEYSYNNGATWTTTAPTGAVGSINRSVTHIRLRETSGVVQADNSPTGGDTTAALDGDFPDVDAGQFSFTVEILED